MATATNDAESRAGGGDEPVVHILWMNGGLGCDGDSVALTAATQPSIEEIALGALPGLPKIAAGPPGAQGHRDPRGRHLRHLRRDSCHGRQPDRRDGRA